MEQTNNVALNLLQAMASQTQLPKTGKSDGDSDFQKLLDKAKSGQPDSEIEQPKKAEKPAAVEKKDAPAQKEDSLSRIKKMLEQNGAFAYMPNCAYGVADSTGVKVLYNPGEYVMVYTIDGGEEAVPITDLAPWQQAQLKQMLINPEPIDVRDPQVEALLKATDPNVEHSPAQMLEELANEVAGVKEEKEPQLFQTQAADGDKEAEVEIIDADQGPQQLFHDVKAAPVKVGEIYQPEQAEKADVAQQIDTGLAQALEQGESMVRIQLTPENLGSVTVEITRSAEGIIRVALSAHSTETRGLLERHAGELQGLLTNRTQQDVEVNVQHNQEGQQGQNQQNPYDGRSGHGQSGQEERRQSRREQPEHGQDFMQQLRLGLIPAEE